MGLQSLAIFVASTLGFLPRLSCTEISLHSGIPLGVDRECRMLIFAVAVQIAFGFLSLILNQMLLSPGVSTHISLVCIYLPILPP